ncbi:hypothetical protein GGF37_002778 [Kickxella alabastrina]|nr:hypothetical protein GGF37_002778 [Kickxella alabastrina]
MVNSLAQLALHLGNFKLQDIASELVLNMAMRREMLQLIVAQAQGSSATKEEGRLRAVVLLQVLVMMPQRVGRVVQDSGTCDGQPAAGFLSTTGECSIWRLCLHCSVSHATYLPPAAEENATEVANLQMVQLLELGVVNAILAWVLQDDQGVSLWGIGFLHEFVSQSVGKAHLAVSPGLVHWLCCRLAAGKYGYTNQPIMCSLWCLCTTQETDAVPAALAEVMQPENLWHVLAMFVSDDDADAHYWSIALISHVSMPVLTHR